MNAMPMRRNVHPSRQRNQLAIALVGLSGTGKSTIGRLLAERQHRLLLDTDALIVASAGRSIESIFALEGEERFRDLEVIALRRALAAVPCVVATGGGIVLRDENRGLLRERAFVVWLDAPTETLVRRLRDHSELRPLLAGDANARLEELRRVRAPLYAEVANLHIQTAGRSPAAACEEIIAAFEAC